MATKLNPGADPTLVSVAYRAGMATAPPDYSDTFENVVEHYGDTMDSVNDMWKEVMKLGSGVAVEAIENAQYHMKMMDAGEAMINPATQNFIVDEINIIRDKIKNTSWHTSDGRKERRKLKKELDRVYAEIDGHAISLQKVAGFLTSGNVDEKAIGAWNMEILNAAMASNTPNKITSQGNYLMPGRHKTTGELIYTLYKAPPGVSGLNLQPSLDHQVVVNDKTGQEITIKAGDLDKLMIAKNPEIANSLTKIWNNTEKNGKTFGGEFTDYHKNKKKKEIEPVVETRTGLKQAMLSTFGSLDVSFFEDLKTKSSLSETLYNVLGEMLTKEDGFFKKEGVLTGIDEMTDGQAGISMKDIQNEKNYMALSGAIMNLDDEDVSRKLLINWAADKYEDAWIFGAGQRKNDNNDGKGGFVFLKKNKSSDIGGSNNPGLWKPNNALNTIGEHAYNRQDIKMTDKDDVFIWDKDKQTYMYGDEVVANKAELFSSILGENFDAANIIDMYNSIPDWDGSEYRKETNPDEKNKGAVELKNNTVVEAPVGKGLFGVGTKKKNIKKIDGVFYVQKDYQYGDDAEFRKATAKELEFIKTEYK